MFKKLVVGALATGIMLSGAGGTMAATPNTDSQKAENNNFTSNKAAKGLAVCNAQYENTKVRTEASTSSKIAYNVANGTRFTGEWVKGQTVNGNNQWLKFYNSNWGTYLYVSKSVCN
ncbi:lysin [Bacillus thuringiensis]|uniref:lysin n=1 Tax=Bacillus thuringiensis TaxID=1428 RepID=UPI000BF8991F|nr:lysin [Bacillus thuringiensis]PFV91619.1 lysin [Bacillus thuringiensis]PGR90189.1 lysin [Bacillus thuringiensis]